MPILTLIIPLKDWEDERLLLLLNSIRWIQKYHSVEVVIVYGSKNPKPLLEENSISTEHIKFIYAAPKGIYNAFNIGVKNASGSWIMFFGGDDLILPSLSNLLNELEVAYVSYDAIICNVAFGDQGVFKPLKSKYGLIFRNWCQQGVLYNKRIFSSLTFDERYPIQADHKFNMEIFANNNSKVKYIEIIIAYFNTSGISQSVTDINFWTDMPKIVSENYGSFWAFVSRSRRSLGKLRRSLK